MPYVAFPTDGTVQVVIPGKQPPQTMVNIYSINFAMKWYNNNRFLVFHV